jgi:hypothetical protein
MQPVQAPPIEAAQLAPETSSEQAPIDLLSGSARGAASLCLPVQLELRAAQDRHRENTEIERPVKSPPGCHDHRGIEYVEGFI